MERCGLGGARRREPAPPLRADARCLGRALRPQLGDDPRARSRAASTSASAASGARTCGRARRSFRARDVQLNLFQVTVSKGSVADRYPMSRGVPVRRPDRDRVRGQEGAARRRARPRPAARHRHRAREADVEPVPRPRAAGAAARSTFAHFDRRDPDRRRCRRRRGRGHDSVRRARRRDARARRDAGGRPAAEIDHARRRRRRRRHRGVVVPPRTRARHGHRARGADRRRAHRPLHAGQRAPRPLLRLSQFVRNAGLRARGHRAARARSSATCGSSTSATPMPPRASPTSPAIASTRASISWTGPSSRRTRCT